MRIYNNCLIYTNINKMLLRIVNVSYVQESILSLYSKIIFSKFKVYFAAIKKYFVHKIVLIDILIHLIYMNRIIEF